MTDQGVVRPLLRSGHRLQSMSSRIRMNAGGLPASRLVAALQVALTFGAAVEDACMLSRRPLLCLRPAPSSSQRTAQVCPLMSFSVHSRDDLLTHAQRQGQRKSNQISQLRNDSAAVPTAPHARGIPQWKTISSLPRNSAFTTYPALQTGGSLCSEWPRGSIL